MAIFSTTRHAMAALLCAGVAVACSGDPATGFQSGGPQTDDAGSDGQAVTTPDASAPSSDDASASAIDSSVGSGDTDSTAPPSTGPKGPPGTGTDSGGSQPTPGIDASTNTGGDGGPCTMNLNCTLPVPASTGDIRQDCVNRVNQFRTQCACMKPLARWNDGEACADMMSQYDAMMMMAHAGAMKVTGSPPMQGICPWGEAQDECPGYPSNASVIDQCLQQMWSEGPPPAGTTVAECESPAMQQSCYEVHGHFINMTNPDVTKIACGFYTLPSGGGIWAAQNLSR